jgi:putative SOS response-associated peptidase YedK
MSRLHIFAATVADIAAQFGAEQTTGIEVPAETTEGAPGLVVIARDGRRLVRSADWGFPRITREMAERGDAPSRIGLVADLTNPFWEDLVINPRYRCIIPLTHFANPDGVEGAKTRTWFSIKDQTIAAWAGFCRNVPNYGPVYAGMTMEANAAVSATNDRMPVLLDPKDYVRWFNGTIQDVIGFQFGMPLAPDRMAIERTEDSWRSGKPPAPAAPQLALF